MQQVIHARRLDELANLIPRVICPGVAQAYKLKVKGRRNSLGLLLPKRRCPWLSGCSPMFAVWTSSNTHISPNFRIPLTEETHDPECQRGCLAKISDKRLTFVSQKAMRQATGYFSGYICKRQPVGRFQLRQAARSLDLFKPKLLSQSSVSGQVAQVVSKMFSTLETRGKLRTAAEECNLAANEHEDNRMNAEFLCLFTKTDLAGYDLVNRLEQEKDIKGTKDHMYLSSRKAPQRQGEAQRYWYSFADVYGFRPPLQRLLYLCPWEFAMHWTVVPLNAPFHSDYKLTRWISPMTRETALEMKATGTALIPGLHYEVNASSTSMGKLSEDCADADKYAVYCSDERIPESQRFRSQWILRKRERPAVPVLHEPVPHRGIKCKEKRACLLSLYLRPWTMLQSYANIYVPRVKDLDQVRLLPSTNASYPLPMKRYRIRTRTSVSDVPWATRSYERAWRSYIKGALRVPHG